MAASIIFPGPHVPEKNFTTYDHGPEEARLDEVDDCKEDENITQYDVKIIGWDDRKRLGQITNTDLYRLQRINNRILRQNPNRSIKSDLLQKRKRCQLKSFVDSQVIIINLIDWMPKTNTLRQ